MMIVIFAMNGEFFLLLLIDTLNIDSYQICVELSKVGKKYLVRGYCCDVDGKQCKLLLI